MALASSIFDLKTLPKLFSINSSKPVDAYLIKLLGAYLSA